MVSKERRKPQLASGFVYKVPKFIPQDTLQTAACHVADWPIGVFRAEPVTQRQHDGKEERRWMLEPAICTPDGSYRSPVIFGASWDIGISSFWPNEFAADRFDLLATKTKTKARVKSPGTLCG